MNKYTLTSADLSKLKAALTSAKKSKDPAKVRSCVANAHAVFDAKGWPDCHRDWQRALNDVLFAEAQSDQKTEGEPEAA